MSAAAEHDILSGELSIQLTTAVRREDLVAASFNRWRACLAIQQHDLRMLCPCSSCSRVRASQGFIIIGSKATPLSIRRLDIAFQSCLLDE
jgi:hypothetical protein